MESERQKLDRRKDARIQEVKEMSAESLAKTCLRKEAETAFC